jgi:hypothetical protein
VVGTDESVALNAAPDGTRRLADGTLVEASVRARLLGLPLLRLEATIALVPASWTDQGSVRREPGKSGRSARSSQNHSAAVGKGLGEAVRSINEAADLLADVRRNGS